MNLFTKIVLKFLSITSLIAQFLFAFVGLILLFATGALLLVPNGVKKQLLQNVDLHSNINLSIITCLFIIMYALHKMIDNIYIQDFFVSQNLTYLKLILIAITSFTILQFISQLLFTKLHVYDVSTVFSSSSPGLIGNILLLAIVYTLYVVFTYGISLQHDSNNVIWVGASNDKS